MLIIEVSSVHETQKHASLNDFCVFSHSKKDGLMLLSSAQRLAEYLKGERKASQLKHHGYLAIREWVLIQNPGEEYQFYDYTFCDGI